MKVFAECKQCREKIYLEEVHEDPMDYPPLLTLECPNGHTYRYNRRELRAEKSGNATAAGAILGGIAGSIGGPAGVVVGAGVGGALGANQDEQEETRVERFNQIVQGT